MWLNLNAYIFRMQNQIMHTILAMLRRWKSESVDKGKRIKIRIDNNLDYHSKIVDWGKIGGEKEESISLNWPELRDLQ